MYIKGLNDNDKVEGENPPIPCLEQCNKKQESKQTDSTQQMLKYIKFTIEETNE